MSAEERLWPRLVLAPKSSLLPPLTMQALQQVLAVLLSSSAVKLQRICKTNGLDGQGPKSALIERLIDHIAMGMREQRRGP